MLLEPQVNCIQLFFVSKSRVPRTRGKDPSGITVRPGLVKVIYMNATRQLQLLGLEREKTVSDRRSPGQLVSRLLIFFILARKDTNMFWKKEAKKSSKTA